MYFIHNGKARGLRGAQLPFISQEISDLFDADKMVDDFGKMIPAFFFRFVWEESNPYIYIYI